MTNGKGIFIELLFLPVKEIRGEVTGLLEKMSYYQDELLNF
jgi:hypothetical protein